MMELMKVDSAMSAKLSQLPHHCFHGSLLLERNPIPTAVLDHRESTKSTKIFLSVSELSIQSHRIRSF